MRSIPALLLSAFLLALAPAAALAAPVVRPVEMTLSIVVLEGFGRIQVSRQTQVTVDEALNTVAFPYDESLVGPIVAPVTGTTAIDNLSIDRFGQLPGTLRFGGVASQLPGESCPGLVPGPEAACNLGLGFGGRLPLTGTLYVNVIPNIVVIPLNLNDVRVGQGGSTNSPFTIDAAGWTTRTGAVDAGTGMTNFIGPPLQVDRMSLVTPIYINALGNFAAGTPEAPGWQLDFEFLDGLPIPEFLRERDTDGDGVPDKDDGCPFDPDPGQEDGDGDGTGDACDVCPADFDPGQEDTDGNGVGDACNTLEDADGDDWATELDNCPADFNPGQEDDDGDGVGQACDNCRDDPNPGQENADGDPRGDVCDYPCSDGLDNDGDGFTDFPDDFGCVAPGFPSESPECRDGIDNDGDGHVDLGDPGCKGSLNPEEDPACDDGIDNDGDLLVDWPEDPGCVSAAGRFETLECDDGIDNDRDGRKDDDDPGCHYDSSPTESPACSDGIDNEANPDGLIDFDGGVYAGLPPEFVTAPDPECKGRPWYDGEADNCGLGAELALVMPLLAAWRRRRRR
jgi:hypothetical protein